MKSADILKQEKELSFQNFTNEDAYCIGNILVQLIKERQLNHIRIRIVYQNEIVYQYLMDGKHGDIWLNRKQKTVETFHHSGYYLYLENEENETYQHYLEDESLVICGGSFPLFVEEQYAGCVLVSGLAHDQDHQLIVDALRQYKQRKALASDIDGTLFFQDLQGSYKVNDVIAIKQFQQKGHLFGVCSGRPLCNLDDIRKLNLDFYIATSGAVILDQSFRIIEEHPMKKQDAKELFDRYHQDCSIIVQTDSRDRFYATRLDLPCPSTYLFGKFEDVQEDKIYGMSIVVDNEEKASLLNQELAQLYPHLKGYQNKNSVDIVVKECSKGTAVKRIKELYHLQSIGGIGDSYNDIPLLDDSDYRFTFHLSPDRVQNHAQYLVDDIEEAIHIMMEEQS